MAPGPLGAVRRRLSIDVEQGIAGRVFGYGSIVVIGTGGTREPFRNIAHPLEFRKQVQVRASA